MSPKAHAVERVRIVIEERCGAEVVKIIKIAKIFRPALKDDVSPAVDKALAQRNALDALHCLMNFDERLKILLGIFLRNGLQGGARKPLEDDGRMFALAEVFAALENSLDFGILLVEIHERLEVA